MSNNLKITRESFEKGSVEFQRAALFDGIIAIHEEIQEAVPQISKNETSIVDNKRSIGWLTWATRLILGALSTGVLAFVYFVLRS